MCEHGRKLEIADGLVLMVGVLMLLLLVLAVLKAMAIALDETMRIAGYRLGGGKGLGRS